MAITTGAQQFFSEALKKDSLLYPIVTRLQQLWSVAIGTSTGALRVLRVALAGVGIGLIIAGVVLLVKAFNDWGNGLTNLTDKQKILKDLSNEVAGNVAKETTSLTGLLAILRDENTTRAQKNEALKQIRAQYPEYLGQLTLENLKTEEGNLLIAKQIDLLVRREQVKKLVEKISDLDLKLKITPEADLSLLEKAKIFIAESMVVDEKGITRKQTISNNIAKQTNEIQKEKDKLNLVLQDLITAETADTLLGNGEKAGAKVGKGIKSGLEKEVLGAFDALQKKISEAEKLLQNLKTEQVEGTKDNVIQIKSLIIELEHYQEILEKIRKYGMELPPLPLENVEPKISGVEVVEEKIIEDTKIKVANATDKITDLNVPVGIEVKQSTKDKIKGDINKFLGIEKGDNAKIKAEKTLNAIGAMENGITNIINQASAIRAQNEIAELENKKKRGLISEKKYQEELSKIKRKEAEMAKQKPETENVKAEVEVEEIVEKQNQEVKEVSKTKKEIVEKTSNI